ncbi:MAG TPA: aquaporin [Mycobacteriales bacterium]|jgi:Glycerol uptake facilitator and related permeases (Major Intrinsic Protein Family)
MSSKALVAEFVGTLVLVLVGVGSVVFGISLTGSLGIALAFGLVLVALVYAIGPVSGSHVNPAVTMGMVLSGRISPTQAVGYWVVQFAGGIVAAGLLYALAHLGPNIAVHGAFGTNGFGSRSVLGLNLGGAFLVEVLLTAVFVFVVLSATATWAIPSSAGIAVGFALAAVHFVGLPLDGAGINPARSLGPAVFARGDALSQVWLFIVAPLVGGALAALVHGLINLVSTED